MAPAKAETMAPATEDTRSRAAALARMEQRLLTQRALRAARTAAEEREALARMKRGLLAKRAAEDAARWTALARTEEDIATARRRREELAWREHMNQLSQPSCPQTTSGRGWKVLEHPAASHESLEAHTREIWGFVWHGIDWPAGWRVRWGEMSTEGLMSVVDWIREWGRQLGRIFPSQHCALSIDDRVLGLCVPNQKIILIDEANQRALHRTPRQCDETLIHELIHAHVRGDGDHGPRFAATLKRATDYYFTRADTTEATNGHN